MKTKNFLICWLPTFIVVFALNGVFHSIIAANFFDSQLTALQPQISSMKDANPLWVGVLDLVLTFGMTYFIMFSKIIDFKHAAFSGALINLTSAVAWNFANAALFKDWSLVLLVADICWHVLLGAAGGLLITAIYNKLKKNKNHGS